MCDGFVGNVLLKTVEGLSRDIFGYLREEIKKDFKARLASPLFRSIFKKISASLDESEYGGSLLLGLKGVCFKCHGSSREKAINQALINQVYPFMQKKINKNRRSTQAELLVERQSMQSATAVGIVSTGRPYPLAELISILKILWIPR